MIKKNKKEKNMNQLKLSKKIVNHLIKANIDSIESLKTMTSNDLLKINGIGPKSLEEIKQALSLLTKPDNITEGIFTKKRYLKYEGRKNYQQNKSIVNKLNGRVVSLGTYVNGIKIDNRYCIIKNN
ncbi:DNA-directed RNA polymerase subunit alpha C-terminal domain-containing protein [Clostridioides difficile]|nr:DNA-directed RNA polymerase subunit alpha C-terminal domain-containing protein [Clostridioides difficile]MDK3168203.1 DNA-directed RNA polymerase subunit alpha C-terminal domain-containing protein [Clostridioides difficile]